MKFSSHLRLIRECGITALKQNRKRAHLNLSRKFIILAMLERMRLTCCALPQGKAFNLQVKYRMKMYLLPIT